MKSVPVPANIKDLSVTLDYTGALNCPFCPNLFSVDETYPLGGRDDWYTCRVCHNVFGIGCYIIERGPFVANHVRVITKFSVLKLDSDEDDIEFEGMPHYINKEELLHVIVLETKCSCQI